MYISPWDERRKAFRVRSDLPLRYDSVAESKHGNTITQDISEGGLRMLLDEFIPKFSKVNLRVNLHPDNLIELNGEVKWVQQIAYSSGYQAGIEFKDIPTDARRSISEYVLSHR